VDIGSITCCRDSRRELLFVVLPICPSVSVSGQATSSAWDHRTRPLRVHFPLVSCCVHWLRAYSPPRTQGLVDDVYSSFFRRFCHADICFYRKSAARRLVLFLVRRTVRTSVAKHACGFSWA